MGGALLAGWIERGLKPGDIAVIEPDAGSARRAGALGVRIAADATQLADGFAPNIVVAAVKPQTMDQALAAIKPFADRGAAVLSVAAGKPIAYFERAFGANAAVLRAMPNTPAAVGRGITVVVANARANKAARMLAERLLAAVGAVEWIEDETLMDAVTAVSGSGPAYVFLLAECLAESGRKAGLPTELAERLARATVAGAGELLHRAQETPETLRRNVTSPGGTTAAALAILMADDGLRALMIRAVEAATRRSRELAG
ncbi:MAG: pyrroline-5-carboxylate reductase [Alphaproteobacteria bacterium]|nr:pyrroline-5-carboxylate reductase [Alphaproteobacteria bacterium]